MRRACSGARTTPFLRPTATPHVVWERICRRAEQRLWASVLEQKLWGTAAREAAQLRAWLHVTRNTTPFIEACVEKLLREGRDRGLHAAPRLQ